MSIAKSAVPTLCACGCRALANPGRRYISGHNSRGTGRKLVLVDGTPALFCPKCGETKAATDFPYKGRDRHGEKRYGYCKPCTSTYTRAQKMMRLFNMTVEDYDALVLAQDNRCAICKRPPKKQRLAIDHDHDTGLIRGLVCWSCNQGLGFWNEDQERLLAAVEYLRKPPALGVLGERYGRKGRTTNKGPKRPKKKATEQNL